MFNDWFLLISHFANDLKHQKYSNLEGRTIQNVPNLQRENIHQRNIQLQVQG